MPRKYNKPEQVVSMLREFEVEIAKGKTVEELCRAKGISANTYYKWRQKYGGMKVDEAKRLRSLEQENNQLKKVIANQALDIQILKEYNKVISSGKY
jgi:transcriptional regulator with XRE-family HTH domain